MTDKRSQNTAIADVASAAAAAAESSSTVGTYIEAAHAFARADDLSTAVLYSRRAVDLEPHSFTALRVLSGFLSANGDYPEAIKVGRRAVDVRPRDPEARLHLGGLLVATGATQEALEHLAIHVELPDPHPQAWRLLSAGLSRQRRMNEAIEAIDHAISAQPANVEHYLHKAHLLTTRARYTEALSVLTEAERVAPASAAVHRMASGNHEALGNLAAAHKTAKQAVTLAPDNADFQVHLDNVATQLGVLGSDAPTPTPESRWMGYRSHDRQYARYTPSAVDIVKDWWAVLWAVMLREMMTRYSRSHLGYIWAIIEPISHLMTLGVMFALINDAPPPIGRSLFGFYASGLVPYLMWAHISTELMHARTASAPLLMLPRVTTFDILIARALLNLGTEVVVGLVIFSGFWALELIAPPPNLFRCADGVLLLAVLGVGIGMINMVIQEFLHSWDTFFQSIVRLLYFGSGIYYSPISMPDFARNLLQWNPILQGVELFRTGFFPDYHPFWLHVGYLLWWCLISVAGGLSLERMTRRHMRRVV